MMQFILSFPAVLWIFIIGGAGYYSYHSWEVNEYEPVIQALDAKKAELATIESSLKKIEEFRSKKDEKLREYNTLLDNFEKTRREFPTNPAFPQLLKSLADITERIGLEFTSFKPGKSEQNEVLQSAKMKVTLKGSYVQTMSFLDSISNLTRVVVADSLKMTPMKMSDKGNYMQVLTDLELSTYYFNNEFSGDLGSGDNSKATQ